MTLLFVAFTIYILIQTVIMCYQEEKVIFLEDNLRKILPGFKYSKEEIKKHIKEKKEIYRNGKR
jgi:hypothetical protein